MKTFVLFLAVAALAPADGPGVILSQRARSDFALTADPSSPQWKDVKGVFADKGPRGEAVPFGPTEIRSRWTKDNIYFLFICPYDQLYMLPQPKRDVETNRLWNYDVAEVFVGTDFENIRRYKEFEMSPQSEWVDLDIDRDNLNAERGWLWNSGWEVKGRIDEASKTWYGEMRIPLKSIDTREPKAGLEMRVNLYRCQGPPQKRAYVAWQPTGNPSFHNPNAFGRLRLAE